MSDTSLWYCSGPITEGVLQTASAGPDALLGAIVSKYDHTAPAALRAAQRREWGLGYGAELQRHLISTSLASETFSWAGSEDWQIAVLNSSLDAPPTDQRRWENRGLALVQVLVPGQTYRPRTGNVAIVDTRSAMRLLHSLHKLRELTTLGWISSGLTVQSPADWEG